MPVKEKKRLANFRWQGVTLKNPAMTYFPVISIIGAGGLNFRVRNGNGCGPSAKIAGKTFAKTVGFLVLNCALEMTPIA